MARQKAKIKSTKLAPPKESNVQPELMGSFASVDTPIRVMPQYGGPGLSSIFLKFPNLYGTGLPYQYGTSSSSGGRRYISINDAILLCQKAYCRVGMYRNAIDIMAEICANSRIYLDDGNAESVSFFNAWLKKINIQKLKEQFFKELFLSGNIFFFRVDGKMTPEGAKKIKQLYAKAQVDLPLRYILLNPANIAIYGGLNFESPLYFRILSKFEIDILKNSKNEENKEVYKNLPDAMKGFFNANSAAPLAIDSSKLHTVFYKKQDYEPFATPLGFPVLDSMELKLAMQRADGVLARSVEYAILLITMGAEKDKGGTNPESLKLLRDAFKSERIGRVLVADYTTKAQFVIPDLNKIIGEEKYKAVNRDISEGMMNIFFEQDASRDAVLMIKIKVFTEKLIAAQGIFLNEFLIPEIKRVSKLMGFKSYPTPTFEKIELDDQSQMLRIYTQLLQMGVLTPKDGLEAIERGILPDYENLHSNQETLKKDKDVGLFQPVTGSPYTQLQIAKLNAKTQTEMVDKQQEHQMNQTKMAQQHDIKKTKLTHDHESKNPKPVSPTLQVVTKPIGTPNMPKGGQPTGRPTGAKGKISMAKLIENVKLHSQLTDEVTNAYKEFKNVKKLSKIDQGNIQLIASNIMQMESPDKWIASAKEYVKSPKMPSQEKLSEMAQLAEEYGISDASALVVFHSINKEE